ncbi:hypothetical protein SDC9_140156 [bioreactor metagenome]|uniref:Uncharacterized protein n=1 Tax=bioreactor metagenome TaxID=1076179 RepID=A0A645DU52_9ZZZZ
MISGLGKTLVEQLENNNIKVKEMPILEIEYFMFELYL